MVSVYQKSAEPCSGATDKPSPGNTVLPPDSTYIVVFSRSLVKELQAGVWAPSVYDALENKFGTIPPHHCNAATIIFSAYSVLCYIAICFSFNLKNVIYIFWTIGILEYN